MLAILEKPNSAFTVSYEHDNDHLATLPKGCLDASSQPAVCAADRKVFNPSISATNNQLVKDQDSDQIDDYLFDTSGNTTRDAQGRTFVYDGENKQIEVKNSQNQTIGKYFYDGDGKRVKKISNTETTVFIYDASGTMVAEYSTAVAPVSDAKVSYTTSDHLGSPRVLTDANGNVISRRDFHPFGEEIYTAQRTQGLGYTADTVRQKFTSYERDNESGLDFAQARYYSSKLGRFYSVDPENAGAMEDDPQSWNGYGYSRNNPVLFTDPDGLDYKVCYVNNAGCTNYTNEEFATYLKSIGGIGFVARGEAKNGNIYDVKTGEAIASFSYFTNGDQDAVRALTGGAEPLLSAAQPIIELIQPVPLPAGGAIIGPLIKSTKVVRTLKKAKWVTNHTYKRYKKTIGPHSGIQHVFFRHGPKSTFADAGKFAAGTTVRKIARMADEAVSNLNGSQVASGNGFIYDFGRVIGTHTDGTLTTKVQVYLNPAGEIVTMFPVK